MLCILKDHVDGLVLENHLIEGDNVLMIDFAVELLAVRAGSGQDDGLTAISRMALWLIPVYVATSPSLSGLNFLIAWILLASSTLWAL